MEYLPWCGDESDDALAWITDVPQALDGKNWMLSKGTACRDWFPKDPVFDLSRRHGVKLSDAIPSTLGIVIVSDRLKQLVEENVRKTGVEFLPVRLRNQKKKLVDRPYFLMNALDVVPCADMKKSDFVMNAISKNQVQYFRRLVLDGRKVPVDKKLFRLGERTRLLLVSRDLSELIVKSECTGMSFQELEDFGREFRKKS